MSTRCQIAFYEEEVHNLNDFTALIYRHSDGYPEGVLPELEKFLRQFPRSGDMEYTSARLLQYMCNQYDKDVGEVERKMSGYKTTDEQLTGELGHGICRHFHGDIDYLYAVYLHQVDVYEVGFGFEDNDKVDINERSTKIKKLTFRY